LWCGNADIPECAGLLDGKRALIISKQKDKQKNNAKER
jgi:hypothetical protein